VSDGSSARHLRSFGWALTTLEGQRLATCSGLVYGNDPSSFRSEATGRLTMLLFLMHIRHYFDVQLECHINLYTDNKGLVDVLPQMTNPFQSSLASFRADWNLLQAIASTLKPISSTPLQVHHVKGHQDRTREVSTLSLPAQLNVEADGLATEFNAPLTSPLLEIPFDPMTKIQLVVGHKTVTSHLRSHIRYQLHLQPLADLIQLRYKWTSPVSRSIDFKSGGLVYRSVYAHRTSATKFIHEQLATGSRLSKRASNLYEVRCYWCGAASETSLHILVCASESGLQWQQSLYSSLRTTHSTTSPSSLGPTIILFAKIPY
jgi:hypothetical protein